VRTEIAVSQAGHPAARHAAPVKAAGITDFTVMKAHSARRARRH
jgi:hypothetical protein